MRAVAWHTSVHSLLGVYSVAYRQWISMVKQNWFQAYIWWIYEKSPVLWIYSISKEVIRPYTLLQATRLFHTLNKLNGVRFFDVFYTWMISHFPPGDFTVEGWRQKVRLCFGTINEVYIIFPWNKTVYSVLPPDLLTENFSIKIGIFHYIIKVITVSWKWEPSKRVEC